jgi:hypothetical protein
MQQLRLGRAGEGLTYIWAGIHGHVDINYAKAVGDGPVYIRHHAIIL